MFGILFDIGMAIGPVIGYILQYRLININKSIGAFSIDICLILLIANILRLNFFAFKQYQYSLFVQSIIMILAQIMLLRICVKYKQNIYKNQQSPESHRGPVEVQYFWRWNNFKQYSFAIVTFTLTSIILTILTKIIEFQTYGQVLGLIALLSESILSMPQIIEIYKRQTGQGISYALIFLNLIGDITKTYYFFLKDQPFQFKLCGVIQISLDIILISQLVYYHMKNQNASTVLKQQNDSGEIKPQNQEETDSHISFTATQELSPTSQH